MLKKALYLFGYEVNRIRALPVSRNSAAPNDLTLTQQLFIEWNAERLDISIDQSRKRYLDSWAAIRGGHGGLDYREFDLLCNQLFEVLYSDSEKETYESYRFYSVIHFLRMLSYPESTWSDNDQIVQALSQYPKITILDFGCGLAQRSRGLAQYLSAKGSRVFLFLADIPTIRKDFLTWLAGRTGITTTFLDCTAEVPIPELPDCEVCFATEFFEHVHNPLLYFDRIHLALCGNGLLITNIADHESEFMHVCPNLEPLRSRVRALGYEELSVSTLYRKRQNAR